MQLLARLKAFHFSGKTIERHAGSGNGSRKRHKPWKPLAIGAPKRGGSDAEIFQVSYIQVGGPGASQKPVNRTKCTLRYQSKGPKPHPHQ